MQLIAELFQVLLPKLKQLFLNFSLGVALVVVVCEGVSPFKNLSRPDQHVAGFFQKSCLGDRIVLQRLENLNFGFNDWPKIDSVLLRFFVIVEALEVKYVPLKLLLGFFSFPLLSCKVLILLGFEDVALPVATSGRSVLTPVAQTNPTELKAAATRFSTCHMVTTLVLFDATLASWTLLCICQDPERVFGLS